MRYAACRGHPEVSWFPEPGQKSSPAIAICSGCPVRAECLAYAAEIGVMGWFGVWGGTTAMARHDDRRERRAAA